MGFNKSITFDDAGYVGYSPTDVADPSFVETLGASFRQENTVGSTISNPRLQYGIQDLGRIDPAFDPFKDIKGYEEYAPLFEEVYNESAHKALKTRIDQERKDRDTLARSGWTGTALSFGVGMIDLPTLIPGGALVRGGKIGYSALKSALAVGTAAGLSTAVTDAARLPAVHGMGALMREALPIIRGKLKSVQIAKKDARDLGAVAETVLQSRLASMADLRDPYRYGNRFERWLDNSSNIFSKLTGIGWWTDSMNMISAVMTENRVLRNIEGWGSMDKYEKAYMGYLGIDEDMAQRISTQFKNHGMEEQGIRGANTAEWDDEIARRAFAAALNKDTDRTIIKPGMGDIPLWMKTNTGRIVTQFKSFGLASHQRVLLAGLQERPRRFAEAMVLSTALGMMVSYLKMVERGDYEKAQNLLDNPGKWIGDGLDRTGILFLPFEVANTADKVSAQFAGPSLSIAGGLSALAGDKDHSGSVTRYASRDPLGAVLGPTAGLFSDLAQIYAAAIKGERTKGATNAALRQIPGSALPGIRTTLNAQVKPALQ